jgi:hypothetical protein
MDDLIDNLLQTYGHDLDCEFLEASRAKVANYIKTLTSAGKHDPEQLKFYGRAYLRELHQPDSRYTGC